MAIRSRGIRIVTLATLTASIGIIPAAGGTSASLSAGSTPTTSVLGWDSTCAEQPASPTTNVLGWDGNCVKHFSDDVLGWD